MSASALSESTRLDIPVDAHTDHALGNSDAEITLVEYGSFNCPSCRAAHGVLGNLRDRFGERLRYVFRHRPLAGNDNARYAAELAEFADQTQGLYWETHDALIERGPNAGPEDFRAVAAQLGLPPRERHEDAWRRGRAKVEADIESARRSGAHVSPTFFINGRRYEGPWDESTLGEALTGSLAHRMQTAALDFARWAPSTGLLLLATVLLALVFSNSPLAPSFAALWEMPFGWRIGRLEFALPLRAWIDDGLLTIFFFVVGLEIKREFTVGRLASPRAAALPFAAALGGMLLPATLYLTLVPPGPLHAGWAIPTTTDTAFAVAVIALLGARVPVSLRVFLTAAVIVDDLVAIAIVAIFYSAGLDYHQLGAAVTVTLLLIAVNRSGVYAPLPYALLGILLWAFLHASGVHATLTGVIVAAVTPARPPANLKALVAQAENVIAHELRRASEPVLRHGPSDDTLRTLDAIHDRIESPASKFLRTVAPWSSYLVLPLFALANAGLEWKELSFAGHGALVLGVVVGLVLGKPLGMFLGASLAVRLGIATKPDSYSWPQLLGAGTLAGIGFTMSLYIASKAFPDTADFTAVKVAIFLASAIAGVTGALLLYLTGRRSGP